MIRGKFIAPGGDYTQALALRKAVFVDDKAIKEAALENPIVKGNYQTADNPAFEVFYLEDAHGVIADFSGNPPYNF